MSEKSLEFLKKEVRQYYDSLEKIYCPYLGCDVEFNLKGFRHILSKGNSGRKLRGPDEQMLRLRLFKWAVKLIRITTTLQESSSNTIWVNVDCYKKLERKMQLVIYWSFVAILNDKRIKVVIKKVGESKPHFWSVIPNWKNKKTPVNSLKAVRS